MGSTSNVEMAPRRSSAFYIYTEHGSFIDAEITPFVAERYGPIPSAMAPTVCVSDE